MENINHWKNLDLTAKYSQLKTLRSLIEDKSFITDASPLDANRKTFSIRALKQLISSREIQLAQDIKTLLLNDVFSGDILKMAEFEASL